MIVVHEVYFGKDVTAPLVKQLSIIRNKFKNKIIKSSVNYDKDVIIFNRLCEKIFGFNSF